MALQKTNPPFDGRQSPFRKHSHTNLSASSLDSEYSSREATMSCVKELYWVYCCRLPELSATGLCCYPLPTEGFSSSIIVALTILRFWRFGIVAEVLLGACAFFTRRMSIISACMCKPFANEQRPRPRTLMAHILVTLHASLHGQPATLKSMGAPKIPGWIGQGLPIDFGVITNVERVHSENSKVICQLSCGRRLTCGPGCRRPAGSIVVSRCYRF